MTAIWNRRPRDVTQCLGYEIGLGSTTQTARRVECPSLDICSDAAAGEVDRTRTSSTRAPCHFCCCARVMLMGMMQSRPIPFPVHPPGETGLDVRISGDDPPLSAASQPHPCPPRRPEVALRVAGHYDGTGQRPGAWVGGRPGLSGPGQPRSREPARGWWLRAAAPRSRLQIRRSRQRGAVGWRLPTPCFAPHLAVAHVGRTKNVLNVLNMESKIGTMGLAGGNSRRGGGGARGGGSSFSGAGAGAAEDNRALASSQLGLVHLNLRQPGLGCLSFGGGAWAFDGTKSRPVSLAEIPT